MAVLGLRFCVRAFSSCGKWGPLFITVRGPLTITASLVAEHRLQMRRLSSCGLRAQPLRGMWDLPRPGLEPVSPALAGGFSTTAPPGKPQLTIFHPKLAFSSDLLSCVSGHVILQITETEALGIVLGPFSLSPHLVLVTLECLVQLSLHSHCLSWKPCSVPTLLDCCISLVAVPSLFLPIYTQVPNGLTLFIYF